MSAAAREPVEEGRALHAHAYQRRNNCSVFLASCFLPLVSSAHALWFPCVLCYNRAMFQVTRVIHFSYGHRLLQYESKGRHLHGHNGKVEIELSQETPAA